VLGLGLIGGSVMRAASLAGREVFGYNRSAESVQAATADGFDATEDIETALQRAADAGALIVVAVPVPALPTVLERVIAGKGRVAVYPIREYWLDIGIEDHYLQAQSDMEKLLEK